MHVKRKFLIYLGPLAPTGVSVLTQRSCQTCPVRNIDSSLKRQIFNQRFCAIGPCSDKEQISVARILALHTVDNPSIGFVSSNARLSAEMTMPKCHDMKELGSQNQSQSWLF